MEKLVLIDGNSLINRAFYAMPGLSTKDGTPTNAVYGFMNMFFKMLSDIEPKFVAVAFDLKAPTFRHKLFSDYKGTRKPMPDDLRPQIPLLKELLRLMGICVLEKEGSEADDIIGTIAKSTSVKTYIFTGDKDSFQLVDDETEVHFTKRGITDVEIYTLDNFTEKTGLIPEQIIELKALMGDSSDNIPGVSGVGEKTAITLLQTYKTVDNIYANIDEIKGKLKEKLQTDKEVCYLSKTLATIDTKTDIDTDLNHMLYTLPFNGSVKRRFIELEFKSLYKKDDWFAVSNDIIENSDTAKTPLNRTATVVKAENIDKIIDFIKKDKLSIFFMENSVNLSDGETELLVPVQQTMLDDGFSLSEVLTALSPLFSSKTTLIVYDKKKLRHHLKNTANLTLSCPVDDVCLMKYLADFSGKDEPFLDVCEQYDLPFNTPAFALYSAYLTLNEKLIQEDMLSLYKDVELPLSDLLYKMEVSGFKIDSTALFSLGEKYAKEIAELQQEIREKLGEIDLNVNSPKQLGVVLFEKLQLAKGKKTKSGYSTTAEILESMENLHPAIPLILKFRQLQKLHSTYIEGFKPLIEKPSGLIHTSFNQTVTATGRLSSKEPNLQNIPVRDDMGKELRKFFVPKSEDRILIGADYSQIELRLLAAFSNCKSLIDAFISGKDIHAQTASKVFGVPLDEVSQKMRSSAKAVNFGIIYGISEYGLAKNLKIENYQAREYINSYFKEYPEVKEYMNSNVEFAKKTGYAKTLLKRKRYIKELLSSNFNLRQFGERVAMNMPLQGSSADIIKLAMLGVDRRLKEENLKSELILQVHDELIVDAFKDEEEQVIKILTEEMEGAVKLSVPLTVSVGVGKTWFDAK